MSFRTPPGPATSPLAHLHSVSGTTYTTTGVATTFQIPIWAQTIVLSIMCSGGGVGGVATLTWTDYGTAAGGTRTHTVTFDSTRMSRVRLPVLGRNLTITIQGLTASVVGTTWDLWAQPGPAGPHVPPGSVLASGSLVLPASGTVTWQPSHIGGGTWYLSGQLSNGALNTGNIGITAILPGALAAVALQENPSLNNNNNAFGYLIALPNAPINIIFRNATAAGVNCFASLVKAD